MQIGDSPSEAAFRMEARAWLEANAQPKHGEGGLMALFEEADDAVRVEDAKVFQRKKAEDGWAGITWPKEYGGRGEPPAHQVIWNQEASGYNVPDGVFMLGIGLAGPTIMVHGTEEQKRRYLPKILSGDEVWCQLFSEPGAGSDLAGLSTRAVRDGDEWVINGQKVWNSGAHYSDWGIMPVRTDVDVPKHRGISYFLVDMRTPGIEVRPLKQPTGGANFNEVFFTDVRVPHSNLLGEVNDGWRVTLTTLSFERAMIGGGGFDASHLIGLAKRTMIGGRPASEHPAVRQELMNLYMRSEGLKFIGYRILTAISKGQAPGPEGSVAKLANGLLMRDATNLALRLLGADGLLLGEEAVDGGEWGQAYLGAPAMRITGGSDEIQRNIIGERVLGLPGEPKVDKDVPFRELMGAKK